MCRALRQVAGAAPGRRPPRSEARSAAGSVAGSDAGSPLAIRSQSGLPRAAPDSPPLQRIFRSGEHNSWHSTAGSVHSAATPTRESPGLELSPFSHKDAAQQLLEGPRSTPRMASGSPSPCHDVANVLGTTRLPARSGPRSSEVILGPPTCGSEIPKEHIVRFERLAGYGPHAWRAAWKDIPAMIQEVHLAVTCMHGAAQHAQNGNMGNGKCAADTAQVDHVLAGGAGVRQQSPGARSQSNLSNRMSSNQMHSLDLTNDSSMVADTLNDFSMHESSISSHGVHPSSHAASSAVCLLYTSPSPRDRQKSRMPSSA